MNRALSILNVLSLILVAVIVAISTFNWHVMVKGDVAALGPVIIFWEFACMYGLVSFASILVYLLTKEPSKKNNVMFWINICIWIVFVIDVVYSAAS
jgi:hypothetical protein